MPCAKKDHDMLSHSETSEEVLEKTLEVVVIGYCWSPVLSLLLWLLRACQEKDRRVFRSSWHTLLRGRNSPLEQNSVSSTLHNAHSVSVCRKKKNYSHFASLYFCIMNHTSFVHVFLGRGDAKQP